MISYRDRTFCCAPCTSTSCPIKFTPAIEAAATQWWGSADAPIALSDYSDTCSEFIQVKDPHDQAS